MLYVSIVLWCHSIIPTYSSILYPQANPLPLSHDFSTCRIIDFSHFVLRISQIQVSGKKSLISSGSSSSGGGAGALSGTAVVGGTVAAMSSNSVGATVRIDEIRTNATTYRIEMHVCTITYIQKLDRL